jgi:hypothetical protein
VVVGAFRPSGRERRRRVVSDRQTFDGLLSATIASRYPGVPEFGRVRKVIDLQRDRLLCRRRHRPVGFHEFGPGTSVSVESILPGASIDALAHLRFSAAATG